MVDLFHDEDLIRPDASRSVLDDEEDETDRFVDAQNALIYALDVPTIDEAVKRVQELDGIVRRFKIGHELMANVGMPQVVNVIRNISRRAEVMLDPKLNDIPNTVAGAMKAIAKLGVWGVTVMANAGPNSLKAAVEHAGNTRVIGVTVLTSFDEASCRRVYGASPLTVTLLLCEMLAEAGVTHVVCSPLEVVEIMKRGFNLIPITPGIVTEDFGGKDQKRTMLPEDAVRAQKGIGHLVIGRSISDAKNRRVAAMDILRRMMGAH